MYIYIETKKCQYKTFEMITYHAEGFLHNFIFKPNNLKQ